MYNFLRGLHRHIYREVYRMRPKTITEAIEDAFYISQGLEEDGGIRPTGYGAPMARGDDGRGRVLVVPRAALPTGDVPRPAPRAQDRPRYGEGPPRPQEFGRTRFEGDRRAAARPTPGGEGQAQPAPAAGVAAAAPGRPAGGESRRDEVEELRQQMARLQLTMQQVMGIDANYYTAQDERSAWGPVDVDGWMYGPNAEVYLKRVAEFEPISLPRKRVAAQPGQTAPNFPSTGMTRATARAAPANPPAGDPQLPRRQEQVADPRPAAPRRNAPAGEAPGCAWPPRGPAPQRWAPPGRPRRGETGERADPVPEDPQAEERRIADEIVSKIHKFNLPLSTALKCDVVNIYARIGARTAQIARQQGRSRQGGETAPAGPEAPRETPMVPCPWSR